MSGEKKIQFFYLIVVLALYIVFIPVSVFANAGVPMIFVTLPSMLCALIPIILIESLIYSRWLKMTYKKSVICVSVSNTISTIVGIPISWGLLFIIQIFTTDGSTADIGTLSGKIKASVLESAWLSPYGEELYWMVPVAAMVGLVPAYFLSVFIEYNVSKLFFEKHEKSKVKYTVLTANNITYLLLFCLLICYLFFNIGLRMS
jgi:hypothetical protein